MKSFATLLLGLLSTQLVLSKVPPGEVIGFGDVVVPFGLTNVIAIAASGSDNHCGFTIALKKDGTVAAWGYGYDGQTNVPAGLSNNVAGVATGSHHVLAVKNDGTVVAWGSNRYGQTNTPAGLCDVAAIAAGMYQSLALRSNGTVVLWGYAGMNYTNVAAGFSNVTAIATTGSANLALFKDGTVVEWNAGGIRQADMPTGLTNVIAICGASGSRVAYRADGSVMGWGYNINWGVFVTNFFSSYPRRNIGIGAAYCWQFAIQDNGSVIGWDTDYGNPVLLPKEFTNIVAIAGGFDHTVAIRAEIAIPRVQMIGPNAAIRFHTVAGRNYTILYSSDLNEWTMLPGGEVAGNGTDCLVIDTNAVQNTARRFYRLKQ